MKSNHMYHPWSSSSSSCICPNLWLDIADLVIWIIKFSSIYHLVLDLFHIMMIYYCINKSHRLPFSNSTLSSNIPLDFKFFNVWCSRIKDIYYLCCLADHYTKCIWLHPLKQKPFHLQLLFAFKNWFFKIIIKQIFSNNHGVYKKLILHIQSCDMSHLIATEYNIRYGQYTKNH